MASGGDLSESAARREIVHYCALLWERRLVTGTSGNVSVRLPGGDILVTPTLRSLRALNETDIVRTDPNGVPRYPETRATSELPLHLAAYRVRTDISAVIHTHPTMCVVWSKTGRIYERDTVGARETLGEVAWTRYEPPGTIALAEVTAAEFARGIDVVVMERHGLSAVGPSLEHAFVMTDLAEEAARIAYFSQFLPSQ